MDANTLQQASAHAFKEFPREACGLIISAGSGDSEFYFACHNLAETPSEHFVLDPQDYADAEDIGKIVGIVHSHPNTAARPSQSDLVGCETSGLPWHILAVFKDSDHPEPQVVAVHSFEPTGYKAPLVGRSYAFGVLDCYSMMQDYYREELGVTLIDIPRRDLWWEHGGDMYMENFERAGFVPISEAEQKGDLILMQIRAPVINHAGIYIGEGKMLHHLYNRLSSIEVYGGYWKYNTRMYLRHKELGG